MTERDRRPAEELTTLELLDRHVDRKRELGQKVLELAADEEVLDRFDTARARRPFDMTAGRRWHTLAKLRRALEAARDDARRAGLDLAELIPTRELLQAALDRQARRRLQRPDVNVDVVQSVDDVRRELELERPAVLERALAGGVGFQAGGTRRAGRGRRR